MHVTEKHYITSQPHHPYLITAQKQSTYEWISLVSRFHSISTYLLFDHRCASLRLGPKSRHFFLLPSILSHSHINAERKFLSVRSPLCTCDIYCFYSPNNCCNLKAKAIISLHIKKKSFESYAYALAIELTENYWYGV